MKNIRPRVLASIQQTFLTKRPSLLWRSDIQEELFIVTDDDPFFGQAILHIIEECSIDTGV